MDTSPLHGLVTNTLFGEHCVPYHFRGLFAAANMGDTGTCQVGLCVTLYDMIGRG